VWHLPLPELPGAEPQRLELVRVPGGTFAIGSPEGEAGRDVYTRFRQGCEGVNVEAPRTVRLKPFALARHPISQAQWQAVARLPEVSAQLPERRGSHEAKGLWEARAQPGALPVDSVSWEQAQEWLRRLNRWLAERWGAWGGEGEAPELALPSESQWEAACQAGTATPFHFGDTLDASWANFDGTYTYGPGRPGPYRQRPVTAGAFGLVNRWGLAELHGQLLEWCADPWHRDPLAGAAGEALDGSPLEGLDPGLEGNQEQTYKLLRGGSWFNDPHDCRSACRDCDRPAYLFVSVGFRVCCLPPGSLLGP
jgi:formylglycine-generating enzyme required for sulfatase activity